MKSGLVAMLFAARALRAAGVRCADGSSCCSCRMKRPVARSDPARWPPRACSRTTPSACCCRSRRAASSGTSNRGALTLEVTVRGRAAHVGLQHQGTNAVERALPLLTRLFDLKRELEATRRLDSARGRPRRGRIELQRRAGGLPLHRSIGGPIPARISTPRSSGSWRSSTPRDRRESISRSARSRKGVPSTTPTDGALARALSDSVAAVTGDAPSFEMCPGPARNPVLRRARRAGARVRPRPPRRVARTAGVREDQPDGGVREDLRVDGRPDAGGRVTCRTRMKGSSARFASRSTAPIEATGHAPAAADVARARGLETAAVEDAYRALADAHVIVLRAGDGRHPVGAAVLRPSDRVSRPRGAVVMVRAVRLGRVRHPGCTRLRCADRSLLRVVGRADPVRCRTRPRIRRSASSTCSSPPRTSGTISPTPERTSCSSGRKRTSTAGAPIETLSPGALMTIPQAWDLSQKWYGNRLEPDFRRPTRR